MARSTDWSRIAEDDPIRRLTAGERRSWRKAERRIVAEHDAYLEEKLRRLQGQTVMTSVLASGSTVMISVAGWQIALAGIAEVPAVRLVQLSQRVSHVDKAGRYGRWWWLAVVSESGGIRCRAVVLASQLRMTRLGGGSRPVSASEPWPSATTGRP